MEKKRISLEFESMSPRRVGICPWAKIDLAVQPDGKNTRNICKVNILGLVSEEKHQHLLLPLKGSSELFNSSLLSSSHSSHARQVTSAASVLRCTRSAGLLQLLGLFWAKIMILASVKMLYAENYAKWCSWMCTALLVGYVCRNSGFFCKMEALGFAGGGDVWHGRAREALAEMSCPSMW